MLLKDMISGIKVNLNDPFKHRPFKCEAEVVDIFPANVKPDPKLVELYYGVKFDEMPGLYQVSKTNRIVFKKSTGRSKYIILPDVRRYWDTVEVIE